MRSNSEPINDTQHENKNHCSSVGHVLHHLWLALPSASFAAKEAANVGAGLVQEKASPEITAIGSSLAFISAFCFTYPTVKTNLHDFNKVRKSQLPGDWPTLSAGKEKAAKWVSSPIALLNSFFDATTTYTFVNMLPNQWNVNIPSFITMITSLTLTGLGAVNSGATEGFETYKVIRNNMMAGEKEPYYNKISAAVAWAVGTPLFLLKTSQDWIQGYYSVKNAFGIENQAAKISIASLSGINMLPGFCFGGLYSINAIDQFMATLLKKDYTKTSAFAFIIAFSLAGWLSWLKRPFNEAVYHEVSGDFSFDNHDYMNPLAEGLSYANVSQETIQWTKALYPIVYCLVRQAEKSSVNVAERLSTLLKTYFAKTEEQKPLINENLPKYDGPVQNPPESYASKFYSFFSRKNSAAPSQSRQEIQFAV